ncbi:hypothetical protein [Halodesulfovibrio sp.]|jgi:hypothetical protein|uniref:hypothetical protein n=1 Tax=Halodesulfovibrio sp. TaxID=1912772 RepID=UPI0026008DE8|nr:hypothetical protein [Halodesulfovibrio sp.]MCT4536427.1 hypothetical protein [Halodesulfovibrio sp.]
MPLFNANSESVLHAPAAPKLDDRGIRELVAEEHSQKPRMLPTDEPFVLFSSMSEDVSQKVQKDLEEMIPVSVFEKEDRSCPEVKGYLPFGNGVRNAFI